MAFNPLAFFPGPLRASVPIIRSAVARGITARETTLLLRGEGFRVRARDVESLFRSFARERATGAILSRLRRSFRPNPLALPESVTKIRRQFSFLVRITGFDRILGQTATRHVSVATDTLLTRGEIEDIAGSLTFQEDSFPDFIPSSLTLVEGRRSGEQGTIL